MEYLPSLEQRTWLEEALADLMRLRGTHPFLSMPLVEPTPRFFPDSWSVPLEGVDRITRRLMQYAGLAALDVQVELFEQAGSESTVEGLFLGWNSNCACFGFNESAWNDVEQAAGIMAHEVAHAFRTYHGLVDTEDQDREEWLTDVTGSYLGFGLLLANNSYRYRTAGEMVGVWAKSSWSVHRVGYLSPQAFAYLLAIQMEARELLESEQRRYIGYLEANQAAFVKAALNHIRNWPRETYERLGFPTGSAEIRRVEPEALLAELPEVVLCGPPASQEEPTPEEVPNYGRPVFRVAQSRAVPHSLIGLAIALGAGMLLGSVAGGYGTAAIVWLAGAVVGWMHGARQRYDVCSDAECGHIIPAKAETCPGCGGTVAGSIRNRNHRLEAEEEYERQHAVKRRGRPMKRSKPRA